jgi:transposase-like protein
MAKSAFTAPQFQTEAAAFAFVESQLWPNGPVCPHCGETKRTGRLNGKTTRLGLHKCYACRKPFTVRIGTIFEDSHLALHLWLQIIHLMCASKKGISTRQIQRMLDCSMTTAWFLGHRIREAMMDTGSPIGGEGQTVEADETFLSKSAKTRRKVPLSAKSGVTVVSLVERGGPIRSISLDDNSIGVKLTVRQHLAEGSRLVTDGANHFQCLTRNHESVDHSRKEYVRGDVHVNTLEGFFSVFKRGLVGVYQHMDKRHLDRYLCEFDFRMNNREKLGIDDTQRAAIALKGFVGKRLTYKATEG